MNNFAVNMQFPLAAGDLKLILNVGSIPSPLVKMTSFLLDLDVSIEQNLPSTDEAIWARINEIRAQKNMVFEAAITDKARALFGQ